jgi:hypothetical protein
MTDHKHKEISWGIWAVLLINSAYHTKGIWSELAFIFGVINWTFFMWHGWKVDRENK